MSNTAPTKWLRINDFKNQQFQFSLPIAASIQAATAIPFHWAMGVPHTSLRMVHCSCNSPVMLLVIGNMLSSPPSIGTGGTSSPVIISVKLVHLNLQTIATEVKLNIDLLWWNLLIRTLEIMDTCIIHTLGYGPKWCFITSTDLEN